MTLHLKRKIPCIDGKDMSKINTNELCINRKILHTNLSHLTIKEKQDREKKQRLQLEIKRGALGAMTEIKYARYLLKNMKINSKKRGHKVPEWSIKEVFEILDKNRIYKIDDIEIPLKLTNSYFNSASIDRINNNMPYNLDNIEIIPHFLNTNDSKMSKIKKDDWKIIQSLRDIQRNENELVKIADFINKRKSMGFFRCLVRNAYKSSRESTNINKNFGFETYEECFRFLIQKYINQGGRCAYLGIPIYPEVNHKYKISIERKDPSKGYNESNILLIVSSLNSPPIGRFLNKNISDEDRRSALIAGTLGFNIDKLNNWIGTKPEKLNEIINYESNILENLIQID
jgi:hypothetical protein